MKTPLQTAIDALASPEEQVYWQPLGMIGVIADLLDGMVDESATQVNNFTAALAKPHVMDDATIDRALRLYGERVHFIEIYCEQLRRWRNEHHPDAKQRREIERLQSQTSRLREMNAHILRLAAEIRKGTINRVMEKSDLELGLEALARWAKEGKAP
jgi:hypothetical protein